LHTSKFEENLNIQYSILELKKCIHLERERTACKLLASSWSYRKAVRTAFIANTACKLLASPSKDLGKLQASSG